jgi:hypothetical protein
VPGPVNDSPGYTTCGPHPRGYPLAEKIAARAERDAGTNPLGLMFPSSAARTGGPPTSTAASWHRPTWPPDGATPVATAPGPGPGATCGTCSARQPCSPGAWKPPTSPARPGHTNVGVILDMYVGATAGILDRAPHSHRIVSPAARKDSGRFTQALMRLAPWLLMEERYV